MVLVIVLLLAKQIITLYHVVQKTLTKDQHALGTAAPFYLNALRQLYSVASGMPSSFATSEMERGYGGNNFLSMASFLSGE